MNFLLDTNTWRSLSNRRLSVLTSERTLLASPLSFWELLTHLDEGDFSRGKGRLLKFRYAEFLDDPQAFLAPRHARLPDDYLIFAFLAALRDAGSLKELYRTAIKAPNDQVRLVDDSVARIQTTLETREQTFLDYHERIVGRIVSGELRLDSDAQLLNAGNSIVEALYLTAPASTSRDSIVDQAYVFSMYVVFLARRSASGGKRAERNDFEDAHLLLHVDRPTPWTLVTDDSAFHQLARQIVAHWQRMGDTLPACQLRVMNQETLLRESGIP